MYIKPLILSLFLSFTACSAFSAPTRCDLFFLSSLPLETKQVIEPEIADILLNYFATLSRKVELTQIALGWGRSEFATEENSLQASLVNEFNETVFQDLITHRDAVASAREWSGDREMSQFAYEEATRVAGRLRSNVRNLIRQISAFIFRRGPVAIIEIGRAQDTALNEYGIATLSEMYKKLAQRRGWDVEVLNADHSSANTSVETLRSITMRISSRDSSSPMSELQFENGLHQLVARGGYNGRESAANAQRTHTIIAMVRVYSEQVPRDFQFSESDIEFATFRASGAGGQHVNRTESAVRATHKETRLQVVVQSERSQHMNKARAIILLRARVYEQFLKQQRELQRQERESGQALSLYVRQYHFIRNTMEASAWINGELDDQLLARQREALRQRLPEMANLLDLEIRSLEALNR